MSEFTDRSSVTKPDNTPIDDGNDQLNPFHDSTRVVTFQPLIETPCHNPTFGV